MRTYSTILLALPLLLGGFVQFVISQFYQKFATDALLLDSAAIGIIFFISRVTDAVLDPVCGYLSDKWNARRRFIFVGLIALAAGMFLAFLPSAVDAPQKTLSYSLAAGGIFLLYFGVTLVYIPHYAWLGALHRTHKAPFFASRAIVENVGTILGGAALVLLNPYQTRVEGQSASLLLTVGWMLALLFMLGVFPLFLYKNTEKSIEKTPSFFGAVQVLFQNKRFAFVCAMSFFNQFAATLLLALSLYYSDYVLHNKELGVAMAIIFLLSATAFVPLWSLLTRKFSKYSLWRTALILILVIFPTLLLAQNGASPYVLFFAGVVGASASAVIFFVPQEVSEVTGIEEGDAGGGLYFAAFTFVNKSAMALAPLVIGVALKAVGYNPTIRETHVTHTISALFIAAPFLAFFTSALLLHFYVKRTQQ